MVDVGQHFFNEHGLYLISVKINMVMYENINKELNKHIKGTVLDIGNGGFFTYNKESADMIVALDNSFLDISKLPKYKNVEYKYGDAVNLSGLKQNSFDLVIFQFILHHLAEKNYRLTKQRILMAISEAKKNIKK